MISFEEAGLRYGTQPEVFSGVNFTLTQGSFYYLSGPSGAGKTSLINLLSLNERPTRGFIRMFNQVIEHRDRNSLVGVRRKIGIVFQDFRLLNHLNVFDNVALPLRIKRTQEKHIQKNVKELLDWVGLGDKMHYYPLTLSGGEQQRISIARAIVSQPHLLLADEPTGNLDPEISEKLMKLFEQLHRMGTTIVMATHNERIIQDHPHPILNLDNGILTERIQPTLSDIKLRKSPLAEVSDAIKHL